LVDHWDYVEGLDRAYLSIATIAMYTVIDVVVKRLPVEAAPVL